MWQSSKISWTHQPEILHNNVIDTQMNIIEKSAKIYNFFDFLQDTRNYLGAKKTELVDSKKQLPINILEALLYK